MLGRAGGIKPWVVVAVSLGVATAAPGQATNTWRSTLSQTWDTGSAWSLGTPPAISHTLINITNAPTKTITVNSATPPASLTISNLFLSAPTGQLNILHLTTGSTTTPLRVLGQTTIAPGGFFIASQTPLTTTGPILIDGTLHAIQTTVTATNHYLDIGHTDAGQLILTNTSWRASEVYVGALPNATGTLTIAGGTHDLRYSLFCGWQPGATGSVLICASLLTTTNSATFLGDAGHGQATLTAGRWRALTGWLGYYTGATGSLTILGGTNEWLDALHLGSDLGATGAVLLTHGALLITNHSASATLEIHRGTFTHHGGMLRADRLILTNNAARFHHTAGTLEIADLILDPNLDADGDGLPNSFELAHDLDPLNPTDAATHLRITDLAREGNHIRITWETTGGQTNRLQTAPTPTGPFTNLGPPFFIPGTGLVTTNYLDLGAATNQPARFYRVTR